MRHSAEPGARLARPLKFAPLLWAWLWRRPGRTVLAFVAVMLAFALYGLALGEAEGFARAAAARHVNIGQGFLLGAMAVSAIGFGLILFLIANATAQGVRLRLSEFGTLKAIGFPHRLILALVMTEAALPCLAGAVAGLTAARLLFMMLTALLPPLAVFPALVYTPTMLAMAGALAIFIGGASGLLPALRIVRLDVAAALAGGLRATKTSHHPDGDKARRKSADTISAAPSAGSAMRRIIRTDMHPLRQVAVVTRIGLSTLPLRLEGALVVVVSLAVVTLAMFPGLIIADALQRGDEEQGRADRAVVTSVGSRWDFDSVIPAGWVTAIKAAPGIARDTKGTLLADAQTDLLCLGGLGHPRVGSGTCIHLIGMEPAGRAMRTDIVLLAGRWPRPGARELMAGVRAASVYDRLAVGKHLQLRGDFAWGAKSVVSNDWRVVGIFSTNSLFDSQAIVPADMVRAAIGRGDASTVVVQLTSPGAFDRFRQTIIANPALHVTVERQTDYYRRVGHVQTRAAIIVEMLIGTLLGLGAMAGVMHTMQVTIEAREGEIAVLRALGFDGGAAAASVVLEAMLLALAGALLGIAILWFWLDGRMFAGALPLAVNVSLTARAVAWACGIAILGAIVPALRAMRMEVARALCR